MTVIIAHVPTTEAKIVNEWLTTQEAAERLGVQTARIRQILWEQRKGITEELLIARKWGRDWQIDAASVERAKEHYRKTNKDTLDEH